MVVYYRAAQVLHYWATEVYQLFLPLCMVGTELIIIFALFLAIRLNADTQAQDKLIIAVSALSIGAISFYNLKQGVEFSSKITESSREFSRIPVLGKGACFEPKDRLFFASCKPLVAKVGGTFIITRQSFLTISQDIILGSLVNLLITF